MRVALLNPCKWLLRAGSIGRVADLPRGFASCSPMACRVDTIDTGEGPAYTQVIKKKKEEEKKEKERRNVYGKNRPHVLAVLFAPPNGSLSCTIDGSVPLASR